MAKSFFQTLCEMCKQSSYKRCAASFRSVLVPVPPEPGLASEHGLAVCQVCKQVIDIEYEVCYDCRNRENSGYGALSSLEFIGYYSPPSPIDYIKKCWKGGSPSCLRPLGALVAEWLISRKPKVDIVAHVPSASKIGKHEPPMWILLSANQWTNGSLFKKYELVTGALTRSGAAKEFKSMGRKERTESDSYQAGQAGEIDGKRVLLFDDVYTTGTSMHRCAELLLEMGALEVHGLVIARTLNERYRDLWKAEPASQCKYFISNG